MDWEDQPENGNPQARKSARRLSILPCFGCALTRWSSSPISATLPPTHVPIVHTFPLDWTSFPSVQSLRVPSNSNFLLRSASRPSFGILPNLSLLSPVTPPCHLARSHLHYSATYIVLPATSTTLDIIQMAEVAPKHPLHTGWSLWYDSHSSIKSSSNWGHHLRCVYTFNFVEDFWRYET